MSGGGGGRAAGGFWVTEWAAEAPLVTVDVFTAGNKSLLIWSWGLWGRDGAEADAVGADGGTEDPWEGYPDELEDAEDTDGVVDVDEEDGPGSGQSSSGLSSSLNASSSASGGTSPTACVNACLLRSQFLRNTLPHDVHS